MSEPRIGVLFMVAACTIWGLSALFYAQISHIEPIVVLSHRTLWSLLFFCIVLLVQGRLRMLTEVFKTRTQLGKIAFAAITISVNWFMFISAVSWGKTVEASLGYYIFPLVAVLLGATFLRERLTGMQWVAVGLVTAAVLILTWGLGVAPWIALILACSFGLYGLIKKGVALGPMVSVATEVMLLSPIAIMVLAVFHSRDVALFGASWHDALFLIGSGMLTGLPLVLFSAATKRISLATVGLIQYLNPTLQFICATLVFQEPFGFWHMLAFGIIWTALVIYSVAAFHREKQRLRAATRSPTPPAV